MGALLPDCNGRLGCYGFSYQGVTQLLAPAGTAPPDCMAPAMAGWMSGCTGAAKGAHWWHLGLGWGLQLAAQRARRDGHHEAWQEIRRSLVNGDYLLKGLSSSGAMTPKAWPIAGLRTIPINRSNGSGTALKPAGCSNPAADRRLVGPTPQRHPRSLAAQSSGRWQPELHIGPATHLQWWPEAQQRLLDFFDRHLKGSGAAEHPEPMLWDLGNRSWSSRQPKTAAGGA